MKRYVGLSVLVMALAYGAVAVGAQPDGDYSYRDGQRAADEQLDRCIQQFHFDSDEQSVFTDTREEGINSGHLRRVITSGTYPEANDDYTERTVYQYAQAQTHDTVFSDDNFYGFTPGTRCKWAVAVTVTGYAEESSTRECIDPESHEFSASHCKQ